MFKSVKDETGSPVSEMSLKDGVTIYQEGEEKKGGEKSFTIYATLTPEDTTDNVVNSAWRFILPSENVFQDWVGMFEAHTLCLLTFNPPVVCYCCFVFRDYRLFIFSFSRLVFLSTMKSLLILTEG